MFLSYDTVEAFAAKRNSELSFPFLKENGELLSIAATSGMLIEPRALELYADVYDRALKIVETYPQYYRFILAIALDLEVLGFDGNMGAQICEYVTAHNFLDFDTSDCRRLEALTLLGQNGSLSAGQSAMRDRTLENVDRFVSKSEQFTKFNKPLFYELTHFVFFLTDYGRTTSDMSHKFKDCLMNIGLLSILDNDADLLSEVCICLHFIRSEIPAYWNEFLDESYASINITYDGTVASALNSAVDEYHLYFVLNWYRACQKKPIFNTAFNSRAPAFSRETPAVSVLSKLSEYIHGHVFSNNPRQVSHAAFEDSLTLAEVEHWQNTILSSEYSANLIARFSNGIMGS